MAQRLELHALLKEALGSEKDVHFQPPENIKLKFPCILYNRDSVSVDFADNGPYRTKTRYQVIVVGAPPDSEVHVKIMALPMCSYSRFYTADNLNHDVYNIYF